MNGIEQLVESAKRIEADAAQRSAEESQAFRGMLSEIGTALTDIVSLMEKANQLEEQEAADERKEDEAQAMATALRDAMREVRIEVQAAKLPAPVVNVQAPNVSVAAPVVNYTPPAINLPAPTVTVTERSLKGAEWQFDIEHHGPGRTTINAKRIA